ncbi:MAG: hypothetical protein H7274_10770 [Rhodoferax sp.]|nr:hypothetical protein [Rhodoferax sp.]
MVALLVSVMALATVPAHAQYTVCGPLENHYGPWDYRTQKDKLRIVEKFHFTPRVESLLGGESTAFLGGDLAYTLATSPNHHRALVALVRFGERTKSPQPPYLTYSIDCYFDRALRFKPDDTVVRTLYASYLGKQGKRDSAGAQLEVASRLADDNGFSHYNIGLAYVDLAMYDQALASAWRARELGFVLTGLQELLVKAGKWQEAPAAQAKP